MTLSPFKCLFSTLTYSLAAACIPCWGPSSSGLPRDVFPPTACACDTLGCSNASHRTSRSAPEKETCSGEKENSKYLSYIFITNRFSIVFGYRGDADFGSCHIVILRKWAQDKEIIKYFSPIRIWRRNVFLWGSIISVCWARAEHTLVGLMSVPINFLCTTMFKREASANFAGMNWSLSRQMFSISVMAFLDTPRL